jgi:hypothetical protein
MSVASRRTVIDALASDTAVWDAAAALMLQSRLRQSWIHGSYIQWQAKDEKSTERAKRLLDDAEQLRLRGIASWKAAENAATQVVSRVVSPAELEAWSACLRRLEWPGLYPDLGPLTQRVERIVSDAPDVRAAVEAVLVSARADLQRTGDATRLIGMYQRRLIGAETPWGSAMQEWNKRMSALMSVNSLRLQLAEERVRLALPPDRAAQLPGKSVFSAAQATSGTP